MSAQEQHATSGPEEFKPAFAKHKIDLSKEETAPAPVMSSQPGDVQEVSSILNNEEEKWDRILDYHAKKTIPGLGTLQIVSDRLETRGNEHLTNKQHHALVIFFTPEKADRTIEIGLAPAPFFTSIKNRARQYQTGESVSNIQEEFGSLLSMQNNPQAYTDIPSDKHMLTDALYIKKPYSGFPELLSLIKIGEGENREYKAFVEGKQAQSVTDTLEEIRVMEVPRELKEELYEVVFQNIRKATEQIEKNGIVNTQTHNTNVIISYKDLTASIIDYDKSGTSQQASKDFTMWEDFLTNLKDSIRPNVSKPFLKVFNKYYTDAFPPQGFAQSLLSRWHKDPIYPISYERQQELSKLYYKEYLRGRVKSAYLEDPSEFNRLWNSEKLDQLISAIPDFIADENTPTLRVEVMPDDKMREEVQQASNSLSI